MSLGARVALGASLVLLVFVALTAITLDRAFRDSALSATQQRLLGQTYLLMAAAEVEPQGRLAMPATLPEARFALPSSGLYGLVVDANGGVLWHSRSVVGARATFSKVLPAGQHNFEQKRGADNHGYLVVSYGVEWTTKDGRYPLTFIVAEELSPFVTQIRRYRRTLWGWLGAMAFLLVLTQALTLRWGLRPLRRVTRELTAIENGSQDQLLGRYPTELAGLTRNLNELLQKERAQQRRYRNALGDLAHSLKTPLAVLRGALADSKTSAVDTDVVQEQVARMNHIVSYQLQRAATAGRVRLTAPVPLRAVIDRLIESLNKVHRDKQVQTIADIEEESCFHGDEGDLMELLGNTLDNAYKWCRHRVRISAGDDTGDLILRIEDDGPGISSSEADLILRRGVRIDECVPGHGIGLAAVRDILEAYDGDLVIERSRLGGAEIRLRLRQS
jgi:two-component system sensor histidine kinase PhoQ